MNKQCSLLTKLAQFNFGSFTSPNEYFSETLPCFFTSEENKASGYFKEPEVDFSKVEFVLSW